MKLAFGLPWKSPACWKLLDNSCKKPWFPIIYFILHHPLHHLYPCLKCWNLLELSLSSICSRGFRLRIVCSFSAQRLWVKVWVRGCIVVGECIVIEGWILLLRTLANAAIIGDPEDIVIMMRSTYKQDNQIGEITKSENMKGEKRMGKRAWVLTQASRERDVYTFNYYCYSRNLRTKAKPQLLLLT
jgi:hypothetical protein